METKRYRFPNRSTSVKKGGKSYLYIYYLLNTKIFNDIFQISNRRAGTRNEDFRDTPEFLN
jgi:hypothetical protein